MGGESETKMGWGNYRASFPKESRPKATDRSKLPGQSEAPETEPETEPETAGDGAPTTDE